VVAGRDCIGYVVRLSRPAIPSLQELGWVLSSVDTRLRKVLSSVDTRLRKVLSSVDTRLRKAGRDCLG
jgi:hypothetical protein